MQSVESTENRYFQGKCTPSRQWLKTDECSMKIWSKVQWMTWLSNCSDPPMCDMYMYVPQLPRIVPFQRPSKKDLHSLNNPQFEPSFQARIFSQKFLFSGEVGEDLATNDWKHHKKNSLERIIGLCYLKVKIKMFPEVTNYTNIMNLEKIIPSLE